VHNILDNAATPLTTLSPGRPAALQQVFVRLTEKRADDRYSSAREAIDALAAVGDGGGWSRLRKRLFSSKPS
jgi:hypothetical protein